MKTPSPLLYAGVTALFLALTSVLPVQAAAQDGTGSGAALMDINSLSEPDALRFVYLVLLPGNHNYNGHRGRAMDEISTAAAAYGLELKERGKGKEDQKKSDARLCLAQRVLEQLRGKLTAEEQEPVLRHVERALKHLAIGLAVRELEEDAAAGK